MIDLRASSTFHQCTHITFIHIWVLMKFCNESLTFVVSLRNITIIINYIVDTDPHPYKVGSEEEKSVLSLLSSAVIITLQTFFILLSYHPPLLLLRYLFIFGRISSRERMYIGRKPTTSKDPKPRFFTLSQIFNGRS